MERERPGGHPVFRTEALLAPTKMLRSSLSSGRTDSDAVSVVCGLSRLSVIASLAVEVGDGFQPERLRLVAEPGASVSYEAIAAAIALDDVSVSERLAALSLASFANKEQLAWPGDRVAAARAGLSKGGYLTARRELEAKGLVAVESVGRGRGNSSTIRVLFASSGPWWDGPLNVQLFDAVLGYGTARGAARVLLATMAVLADEAGVVEPVSREELCDASGLPRTTFRRAKEALLLCGAVVLDAPGGGRGNMNRWRVVDPRERGLLPQTATSPSVASAPRRPLLLPVAESSDVAAAGGEQVAGAGKAAGRRSSDPGSSSRLGPRTAPLSAERGSQTAPFRSQRGPKTGPRTGPRTGPARVRAGGEASNPGIQKPPNPPAGGSGDRVLVERQHVTAAGRRRKRVVELPVAELCHVLTAPTCADQTAWEHVRGALARIVGEDTFGLWLDGLRLEAITPDDGLLVVAPEPTRAWVVKRFARAFDRAGSAVGRAVLIAEPEEAVAISHGGIAARRAGTGEIDLSNTEESMKEVS